MISLKRSDCLLLEFSFAVWWLCKEEKIIDSAGVTMWNMVEITDLQLETADWIQEIKVLGSTLLWLIM